MENYVPFDGPNGGGISKASGAYQVRLVTVEKDADVICIKTIFMATACQSSQAFRRMKTELVVEDSFRQSLIYSGRIEDIISVAYRESPNEVLRPAFSNDVQYDLGESDEITYKGARLKILEANNESIRYQVMRGFQTDAP